LKDQIAENAEMENKYLQLQEQKNELEREHEKYVTKLKTMQEKQVKQLQQQIIDLEEKNKKLHQRNEDFDDEESPPKKKSKKDKKGKKFGMPI
jgi:hypothetical protein